MGETDAKLREKLAEVRAEIAEAQDEIKRMPPGATNSNSNSTDIGEVLGRLNAWCTDAEAAQGSDDSDKQARLTREGEELQHELNRNRSAV